MATIHTRKTVNNLHVRFLSLYETTKTSVKVGYGGTSYQGESTFGVSQATHVQTYFDKC